MDNFICGLIVGWLAGLTLLVTLAMYSGERLERVYQVTTEACSDYGGLDHVFKLRHTFVCEDGTKITVNSWMEGE